MTIDQEQNDRFQEAAEKAYRKMLECLIEFTPAEDLTISNVTFIARYAKVLTHDALREVHEDD